jgi:hypothetical protein
MIFLETLGNLSGPGAAGLMGLIAGFLVAALIIGLLAYVYCAIALMSLAKRTKTPNAWLAWIPIANIYLITQIAKLNGLWTLAILLVFIPVVGGLAFFACTIWWFWLICERRKLPGALSLLMLIPFIGFLVLIGVLAWKD